MRWACPLFPLVSICHEVHSNSSHVETFSTKMDRSQPWATLCCTGSKIWFMLNTPLPLHWPTYLALQLDWATKLLLPHQNNGGKDLLLGNSKPLVTSVMLVEQSGWNESSCNSSNSITKKQPCKLCLIHTKHYGRRTKVMVQIAKWKKRVKIARRERRDRPEEMTEVSKVWDQFQVKLNTNSLQCVSCKTSRPP